jgi:hypothetical protein
VCGGKKKRGSVRRSKPKKLRPELREFLDRCIIPALVEKYLAERKGE